MIVAWSVLLHPEVEAWMRTLDEKTTAGVLAAVDALGEYGPTLKRPLSDTLSGSAVKNLKELRPGSSGHSEVRIPKIEQDAYVAGYRLAELRGKTGMTQTQLADAMGVSQARVSATERGEVDSLTVASVRAYITALGGTVRIVASLDDTDVTLRLPNGPRSSAA